MTKHRKPSRLPALFERQHPTVKAAICAIPIVLAVSGAAHIPFVLCAVVAAVAVWLLHRSDLLVPDVAPEDQPWLEGDEPDFHTEVDELVGEAVYQATLEALQPLLGEEVTVRFSTVTGSPIVLLEGVLSIVADPTPGKVDEVFVYLVDEVAAFYVQQDRLGASAAEVYRFDGGVEFIGAEGIAVNVERTPAGDRSE